MLNTILVTGGTGSLGSRIVKRIIDGNWSYNVVVFSRGEQKQFNMRMEYESNIAYRHSECPVKFVIGNVQDKLSVQRVMSLYRPDVVIHTAAQKHVRICDENPEQAVLTNIIGTSNVVDACIDYGVPTACFVSTDKAVLPTTSYGMTKSIAEKIIMNANGLSTTRFTGVRYGNVVNSAGSLIPLYQSIAKSDKRVFTVTHSDMTRFFITFDSAIDLIMYALSRYDSNFELFCHYIEIAHIDDIFLIPKLKSARIVDIAEIFASKYNGEVKIASPYPSEKIHEILYPGYSSADYLMTKDEIERVLVKEGLL